jgi:salicylate hydroxylase
MSAGAEKVAIAGAGIGGLAAALALAHRGINAHVFERRSEASEAGAGIQIGPNGSRVLQQLGVLDAVRTLSAEPAALSVHDGESGRVLARLPLGAWMQERFGAPYLTIHRQDLHATLLAAAKAEPRISITTGCEISGFENGDCSITCALSDTQAFAADALIAADGLWSRLRSQVTHTGGPEPFGKCAYRTVLPHDAFRPSLQTNHVHIWLMPGAHAVHYPVRQGREIALVVIVDGSASENDWSREAKPDWLQTTAAAQFAPKLRDILARAENWRMWPLQKLAPLSSWTNGRVALLGDAAHPLLPFFAQGGGLALEDAAVLAAKITENASPMPERLKAYEAARRARALRVVEASHTNGRIYHRDGAAAAARNAVLASVPPSLLMRRYDWLYGWKA